MTAAEVVGADGPSVLVATLLDKAALLRDNWLANDRTRFAAAQFEALAHDAVCEDGECEDGTVAHLAAWVASTKECRVSWPDEPGWTWDCTCGAGGGEYYDEDSAHADAESHTRVTS